MKYMAQRVKDRGTRRRSKAPRRRLLTSRRCTVGSPCYSRRGAVGSPCWCVNDSRSPMSNWGAGELRLRPPTRCALLGNNWGVGELRLRPPTRCAPLENNWGAGELWPRPPARCARRGGSTCRGPETRTRTLVRKGGRPGRSQERVLAAAKEQEGALSSSSPSSLPPSSTTSSPSTSTSLPTMAPAPASVTQAILTAVTPPPLRRLGTRSTARSRRSVTPRSTWLSRLSRWHSA